MGSNGSMMIRNDRRMTIVETTVGVKRIPENKPIWVWQKEWKHIVVQCEFWDIRHRSLIKTGPLPTPWMDDLYDMWKILKN